MELFPDIGVQMGQLTVVSISQHTQNDMSAWSPDVEEERESLMASVSVINNISNTRDSVSSGYPNTKKTVENTTQQSIFDKTSRCLDS